MESLEFNKKYLERPSQGYGDYVTISPVCIPRIVCKDGYSVSVQAGSGNYCSPRDNNGPWFAVELGFPSEGDDRIAEYMDFYAEDPDHIANPSECVFGYVPLHIVLKIFEDHGGIDEGATQHWSDLDSMPKKVT